MSLARTLALSAILTLLPAAGEQLCPGARVMPASDGRLLGHLPYGQARMAELAPAPAGFAIGAPCLLNRAVLPDLARLLAAANADPAVRGRIRAVSCFRTVEHQRAVFCSQIGPRKRSRDAADRARFVGPPGFSEHATGFALDFGTRPSPGCADVEGCFGRTAAGRWLLAHAPQFGFELSFPEGNAQGVSFEPWHWRWVGTPASPARDLFVRARTSFPPNPAVAEGVAAGVPQPSAPSVQSILLPMPMLQPPPREQPQAGEK